jgi:CBS domain-containing protein
MRMGRMRRLPVVDGMGKLIGIVTLDDILRLLAAEIGEVEQLLEAEAPRAALVGPHGDGASPGA